jgi:pimeloyl-ACP methyl ester carboxylesterase
MSYGSYLAQTLMRDHPEGIRSVVLDSVLPTTYTAPANWWNTRAGFDNLFQACAAEPACLAAHPHLEDTFTGLVNKFEAEPLTATVRDPATGEDVKVLLDGGALVDWLRNQNYSLPTLQAAPNRIDGLATGRPEALEAIALDRVKSGSTTRSGCSCPRLWARLGRHLSRRLPVRDAGGSRRGRPGSVSGLSALGDDARVSAAGHIQRRLPRGLEGPRRPGCHAPASREQHPDAPHLWQLRYADVPRRAKAAAAKLSNATIISIPGIGHAVSPSSPCAQSVIVSFLADPAAPTHPASAR